MRSYGAIYYKVDFFAESIMSHVLNAM